MAQAKQTYKSPQAGQPLITNISSACYTPPLEVKFCNLVKPYYYPNSPTVPRYSVTCVVDLALHKDFIKGLQTLEKNEGVESIIKNETTKIDGETVNTGKVLLKFQSKDKIPVWVQKQNGEKVALELEDELAKGEKIVVNYDILRYTKKNTAKTEHGLSFKPSSILFFPKEE